MNYPVRVLTIGIGRPIESVAAYLAEPRNFPAWASGLTGGLAPASTSADEREWVVETPDGRITIRFSPRNPFGVADHWVELPDGRVVYVPLRAVANGDGSEVSLTLFRTPDMDEARFEADAQCVQRDFETLKRVLESG